MADVEPLLALHYDLERVGTLQDVVAPPYDVIDADQRAELEANSPYNVVRIDLPVGDDPYEAAAQQFRAWQRDGVIVRDEQPAIWALEQTYTGPDGLARTRRGFLARVRVEQYGPGRIRPHERTHPGPREDRLRLTRATKSNLSPIFSLFDDPAGTVENTLGGAAAGEPWGLATDEDGTVNRLWRVADEAAITTVTDALGSTELLIADGHHRYETACTYLRESGGSRGSDAVLAFVVELAERELAVQAIHRLLSEVEPDALVRALEQSFELRPGAADPVALQQEMSAAGALGLVLEHGTNLLVPRDAELGTTEDDLDSVRLARALEAIGGVEVVYQHGAREAVRAVEEGRASAAVLLRPVPVHQIRAVAHGGQRMPPKTTFFYPKLRTGLVFRELDA
jgi:uncharacterized protein (DUF1015 family)